MRKIDKIKCGILIWLFMLSSVFNIILITETFKLNNKIKLIESNKLDNCSKYERIVNDGIDYATDKKPTIQGE